MYKNIEFTSLGYFRNLNRLKLLIERGKMNFTKFTVKSQNRVIQIIDI